MSKISILKLSNIKLNNGGKIIDVPGIDLINTKKNGKLYVKKYFLKWKNLKPRMIRFTSKNKSFKSIYSLDICNKLMEPVVGFKLKDNTPIDKIIKFITGVSEIKNLNKKQKFSFDIKSESISTIDKYKFLSEQSSISKGELIGYIFTSILSLVSLLVVIWFYIKQIINWKIEQETYEAENEINKQLFQKQTENDSAFEMYSDVIHNIHNVTRGESVALILCGPPGMSKTYITRRTFHFDKLKPGRDYIIQKGATVKITDVYQMLFEARTKILVLDDFDTPLQDINMVNFLKSITDSYSRRIISMPRSKMMDTQGQQSHSTPNKFEFKGKIIIITNLKRDDIDRALLSRCPTINVNYNTEQVIKSLEKMLKYINPSVPMSLKKEVFTFIKQMKHKYDNVHVDFRTFKNSIDARTGIPENWKEIVLSIHGIENYR